MLLNAYCDIIDHNLYYLYYHIIYHNINSLSYRPALTFRRIKTFHSDSRRGYSSCPQTNSFYFISKTCNRIVVCLKDIAFLN